MAQALVRTQSPEEKEYARYEAEIGVRKRRVVTLHADLAVLTQALGRFRAEYGVRVGALFLALDRARLAIDQYERRIAALRRDPTVDAQDLERRVRERTAQRAEQIHEEEAETRHYEQMHRREQAKLHLDGAAQATLQQLYRELCKRYHPDLAKSAEQRERCKALMRRINAAYSERRLPLLQAMAQEGAIEDTAFEAKSLGDKLVWAIREVARLDEVAQGLDAQLAELRAAEIHTLWQRQQAGEAVLETLEARVKGQLATAQEQLATLIMTYRDLVERRVA